MDWMQIKFPFLATKFLTDVNVEYYKTIVSK